MPISSRIAGAMLITLGAAPVHAQTADEAIVMVKKAKAHLHKQGVEQACKDFSDPAGGFQKGELYVSVMDARQAGAIIMVCNAKNPRINGKDLSALKDVDGKLMASEMVQIAKANGRGWIDYRWVNPVSGNIEPKRSYVESQDGLLVVTGIYKK